MREREKNRRRYGAMPTNYDSTRSVVHVYLSVCHRTRTVTVVWLSSSSSQLQQRHVRLSLTAIAQSVVRRRPVGPLFLFSSLLSFCIRRFRLSFKSVSSFPFPPPSHPSLTLVTHRHTQKRRRRRRREKDLSCCCL